MKCLNIVWVGLFLVSCDTVVVDFFQLGSFRLLAIHADHPEIDGTQDQTIVITPWISDIDAGGRLIQTSMTVCPDPGVSLGALPTCDLEDPLTTEVNVADFDTTSLSNQSYTGPMDPIAISIAQGALENLGAEQAFNGINWIVSMRFSFDNEVFDAFRRIKISSNPEPNINPLFADILIDGSASANLSDQAIVTYSIDPSTPAQNYEVFNAQGELEEKTENYIVTWFVYGGELSLARSEIDQEAMFTSGNEFEGDVLLVGVLRDGRGGLDLMIRN